MLKILSALVLFFSIGSFAYSTPEKKTEVKSNRYQMKVDGMVCNLCVQSIKNRMMKNKEVQNVEILLEQKQVVVTMHPGQDLSQEKIKESISDTGYTPEELKRIE